MIFSMRVDSRTQIASKMEAESNSATATTQGRLLRFGDGIHRA